MFRFRVDDMTCGHCVSRITRALQDADAHARIDISLAEKRVSIETSLEEIDAARAIAQAGYTPGTFTS